MRKAFLEDWKYERRSKSRVAPRLSELDTKRYLMPSWMRLSRKPDPSSDG